MPTHRQQCLCQGPTYGLEAGQGVKQRMKMARAAMAQIQRARPRRSQGS